MSSLAAALIAATAATTLYSDYPAFVHPGAVVEAYTDRGPIIELIVKCPDGTGIMSYSKIERLYCSSKHACFRRLQPALRDTCS